MSSMTKQHKERHSWIPLPGSVIPIEERYHGHTTTHQFHFVTQLCTRDECTAGITNEGIEFPDIRPADIKYGKFRWIISKIAHG